MAKKYLVTGVAGFIGSSVARRLINLGHEVWTIDNLSTGYLENIPEGTTFIKGNCHDQLIVNMLGDIRFDAILHIAGQSSGEISFANPIHDLRTNTESTLLLMKHALKIGCTRFIYASSMSVYGKVEDAPIGESHECQPLSFYGVGKLASENYMRIYQSLGIDPTALRLFNVYGPGQNMNNLKQGMVSIYLSYLLKDEILLVKGSMERFRDFIYIDDVVDAFLICLKNSRSIGKVYNVGSGRKVKVNELIDALQKSSGISKPVKYEEGTPGDQAGIYADVSKIKDDLGYESQWSLEKGLNRMIEWARGNP